MRGVLKTTPAWLISMLVRGVAILDVGSGSSR
jgi:hypothetical protein